MPEHEIESTCDDWKRRQELWREHRAKWLQHGLRLPDRPEEAEDDASQPVPRETETETEIDTTPSELVHERGERVPRPSIPVPLNGRPRHPGPEGPMLKKVSEFSLEQLSEADRLNLRSCLAATSSPYPKLRRSIPLRIAIQCGVQLWTADASPHSEESPLIRLSQNVRESTQDIFEKTAALGNSIASWSSSIFGSASQALEMSPCRPTERKADSPLVESIRARGGLGKGRDRLPSNEEDGYSPIPADGLVQPV
mmetsp:Transcript_90129/g.160517  ORF Transcript_90129/g.160517 Transcript_90129/m.160517 type:complete len:254 (+) Transcript_90129:75-836(+)